MASAADTEWQLPEGSHLRWKCWDDEYVVFDEGSGNTHLLDPVAAEVLRDLEQSSLERRPADVAGLTLRIASQMDLDPDPGLCRRVREAIETFHGVGLVEPALS